MVAFNALGLVRKSDTMTDAIKYATDYVDNTGTFTADLCKAFDLWRDAYKITQKPTEKQTTILCQKAQALVIRVRFADWIGANKYGDALPGIIWINPVLVAAAEETDFVVLMARLTDLIRVKLIHEFYHQLTPLFAQLCRDLGATGPSLRSGAEKTPVQVGKKADQMGDNGYAFEESVLGGRLFVKSSNRSWTRDVPLVLETRVDRTDNFVRFDIDSTKWTTEGKHLGPPDALRVPPEALIAQVKRGRTPATPTRAPSTRRKSSLGLEERGDREEEEADFDIDDECINYVDTFSYANLPSWHPDAQPDEEGHKS
jgi:hypothetical protein